MTKIVGVNIWGKDKDERGTWEVIKELYADVLHKDPNWHYFYEIEFDAIRYSARFHSKVKKMLAQIGMSCSERYDWEESNAVGKYKDIFRVLFHTFSVMAIECDRADLYNLYDRVSHCYLNNQYHPSEDVFRKSGSQWESMILGQTLIDRAAYAGICDWARRSREKTEQSKQDVKHKEKEDDTDE